MSSSRATAAVASLVCRVEMTRPRRRVHRRLVHARQAVLDGVLDGGDVDHVLPLRADARQHRVERRRLAGARGPGDEDHPEGAGEIPDEHLMVGRRQPEVVEVDDGRLLRQDPEHDLLSPHRRQRGDAQREAEPIEVGVEAAVLRRAAVVDPQAAEDLDARDEAGHRLRSHAQHVAQRAVDPAAHERLELVGLDVDVGGAGDRRVLEDPVEQRRRRLVAPGARECARGPLGGGAPEQRSKIAAVEELGAADRGLRRQGWHEAPAGHALDLVDDASVARVGHRDVELLVVEQHRDQLVLARVPLAHGGERRGGDVARGDVEEAHRPRVGELLEQERHRDAGALDEDALERHAQARRRRARAVEVGRTQQLQPGDHDVPQIRIRDAHAAGAFSAASTAAMICAGAMAPFSR
jgi:hypothetical protein